MNQARPVAVAAALLVAATVWMMWQIAHVPRPVPAPGDAPSASRAAPADTAVAAVPPPVEAATPPRADGGPPGPDEIEVCGLGRVRGESREDAWRIAMQRLDAQVAPARAELLDRMLAAPEAHERALGRYLRSVLAGGRAEGAVRASSADCSADAACEAQAREAGMAGGAADRDALAAEAATTADPRVYTIAWWACRSAPSTGACQQINAGQWARLDGDNAVPWLEVASVAASEGDAGGADEALFRASRAPRSDPQWGLVLGLLQRDDVAEAPPAVRLALGIELMGVYAALPLPGLRTAVDRCPAGSDVNRQQLCADLATLLTERSTTLVEWLAGARLARAAAGWDDERLQQLDLERDALTQIANERAPAAPALSCEAMTEFAGWAAARAAAGELAATRDAVLSDPRGLRAIAERWRERRRASATAG